VLCTAQDGCEATCSVHHWACAIDLTQQRHIRGAEDNVGSTQVSYDKIAEEYAARFLDELATKPLDRALLDLVATEVNGLGAIADIGCGPGHVAGYLHNRGATTIGLDLSARMIDTARVAHPDIAFDVGDMRSLQVPDQAWGGIVALYSIIHIAPSELTGVFVEFYRVLRPGGTVLLSFHVGDEVRHVEEMLGRTVDLDFQFYERPFVESSLEQAGLSVSAYVERQPYPTEVATTRGYLLARRNNVNSDGAKPMRSVHVVPADSVSEVGVVDLLAQAVGGDPQRVHEAVQRYRDDPAAVLLVAMADHRPVGAAGYLVGDSETVLLHIATAQSVRRTGIGRQLLASVRRAVPSTQPLIAETDADGVGFYTATGFAVTSLGEKYPGVERFHARLG
jgi:trans-aconitate methyltransferase/GNAT superfamily N-acetyltransferase